jgi:hypothetical protein
MSAKINKHVFHGFFSNFGYTPNLSINKRRYANFPIHFFRATFAEEEEEDNIIQEFNTEEDVLRRYKKNIYGTDYDKIKSEGSICKNYFTISESEFFKYRHLFHRMIKGYKLNYGVEVVSEGTVFSPQCPESKAEQGDDGFPGEGETCNASTAGPIVFNSPNGESSYFTVDGVADDVGFLNGTQITDGTLGDASGGAGPFNQEKIPKTKQTTLSIEGKNNPYYCGPYGISATVTWYKQIDFKQKINFSINFDSTKIFEFSELQKRLPADDVSYITNLTLEPGEENKNTEELDAGSNKVFKDEWEFNLDDFKKIFLFYQPDLDSPNNNPNFNINATVINDPVLLRSFYNSAIYQTNSLGSLVSGFIRNNFIDNDPLSIDHVENKQKQINKVFNKFGSIEYKISNENTVLNEATYRSYFKFTRIFYIRSKKIYLIFVEFANELSFVSNIVDKIICPDNPEQTAYSVIESAVPVNTRLITTSDSVTLLDSSYTTNDCNGETKLLYEKKKFKVKLLDKTFEIEALSLKDKEFNFNNESCSELSPHFRKEVRKKVTFTVTDSIIEILPWQDQDFSKNNVYPLKI